MTAVMWQGSLVPWIDENGDPYAGAKAYFFNAGTTTPRTVYQDGGLSIAHDHPVVANSAGRFPAIFLPTGNFRLRILDADDVTIEDVDNIAAPIGETQSQSESETPDEFLFTTGDLKYSYRTGALTGYVRCNGRTIGDAVSGATERANADCEDLFTLLWNQDSTLTVSGGRGANAASDWAASKTIALPDFRDRVLSGRGGMGNTPIGLVIDGIVDNGETSDTLGATSGAGRITLDITHMPSHNHGGSTSTDGAHVHGGIPDVSTVTGIGNVRHGSDSNTFQPLINTASAGAHNHTISSQGGGNPHVNMQPTAFVTVYIKL